MMCQDNIIETPDNGFRYDMVKRTALFVTAYGKDTQTLHDTKSFIVKMLLESGAITQKQADEARWTEFHIIPTGVMEILVVNLETEPYEIAEDEVEEDHGSFILDAMKDEDTDPLTTEPEWH